MPNFFKTEQECLRYGFQRNLDTVDAELNEEEHGWLLSVGIGENGTLYMDANGDKWEEVMKEQPDGTFNVEWILI